MTQLPAYLPSTRGTGSPERDGITVLVVDDQTLHRSGLVRLLEDDERLRVVGVSSDRSDVPEICAQGDVDVVVTGLDVDPTAGIELTRRIVSAAPGTRVLVLSTVADARVVAAFAAGAVGFLLSDTEPAAVRSAILAVHLGEHVLCAQASRWMLEAARGWASNVHRLTRRETDVLRLVAAGASNERIAARLSITDKTVRNHVSNLYHKLALHDRAQVIRFARQAGIGGAEGQ